MSELNPIEVYRHLTGNESELKSEFYEDNSCKWILIDGDKECEITMIHVFEQVYSEDEYAERSLLIVTNNDIYGINTYYNVNWNEPSGNKILMKDEVISIYEGTSAEMANINIPVFKLVKKTQNK